MTRTLNLMRFIVLSVVAFCSFVLGTICAFFYVMIASAVLSLSIDGLSALEAGYIDYGLGMLLFYIGTPIFIILIYLFTSAIWHRLNKVCSPVKDG